MGDAGIKTVGDLISVLEEFDRGLPVRVLLMPGFLSGVHGTELVAGRLAIVPTDKVGTPRKARFTRG